MFKVNDLIGFKRYANTDEIELGVVTSVNENLVTVYHARKGYKEVSSDTDVISLSEKTHERAFLIPEAAVDKFKNDLKKIITEEDNPSKKIDEFKKIKCFLSEGENAAIEDEIRTAIANKLNELNSLTLE